MSLECSVCEGDIRGHGDKCKSVPDEADGHSWYARVGELHLHRRSITHPESTHCGLPFGDERVIVKDMVNRVRCPLCQSPRIGASDAWFTPGGFAN